MSKTSLSIQFAEGKTLTIEGTIVFSSISEVTIIPKLFSWLSNKYITLNVGGSLNPKYNKTLKVTGKIINITDGKFQYKGKVYNGRKVEMGRCVVLKINNINLLIAEKNMPTTDPEMYRSQGIEPREMKFVIVKSPLGLRTEYEPISKEVISVDTKGCCRADLTKLPFKVIPKKIFPFNE